MALGIGGYKIIGTLSGSFGGLSRPGGQAGHSVSSAGDVNGDGFDDLIVGEPGTSIFPTNNAYVVFGAASGIASVNLSDIALGVGGFKITGARVGFSVSSAGDVNGDGFDDVIIGAGAPPNGSVGDGLQHKFAVSSSAMKRSITHILLVAALSLWLTTSALAGFEEGFAAYNRGDYATAFEEWLPVAEEGIAPSFSVDGSGRN